MNPKVEPLLWLQLLALGLIPLELLLLLLVLAGAEPGLLPAMERLICWAIGAALPAMLLWRHPADVWSLLLIRTPLRGRRDLQLRLSALQNQLGLRVAMGFGAALLLPLLWRLDQLAPIASEYSPFTNTPRLPCLLLAAIVLALLLWQWQQLLQAGWLLTRSSTNISGIKPMTQTELEERRLCLGLPLLMPGRLQWSKS